MEPVKITEGQARVAHLVGMGYSNAEVARTLGLSRKTVKNHLNTIYARGGVVNRNELIQAYREGSLGIRHDSTS